MPPVVHDPNADAKVGGVYRTSDPTRCSDEALLAALVGTGAPDGALAELDRRYRPKVQAWVLRRHADADLADEVAIGTLRRLWQQRHRFDPERGSAAAWVFVLARTTCADLLRARRRNPVPVARIHETPPAQCQADQIVATAVVVQLLERLSPDHREVICLAFIDGLTRSEIAARLGLPLGTVKTRAFYGMRALRLAAEELGLSLA